MWTDWDQVSAKLIELACDPHISSAEHCADTAAQLDRVEQLEQWVLAFLSGMAFVLVWSLWEWAWNKWRPAEQDEAPAAPADLYPLLRRGGRHGQ